MQALNELSRHEKALVLAEAALSAARAASGETGRERPVPETCTGLFAALEEFDPGYARLERTVGRRCETLVESPVSANWIALREALARAADELEIRHGRVADEREAQLVAYRRAYDAVTLETVQLSILGLAVFGSAAAWFFSRLARDIRRLESHARQIVQGRRGVMLAVTRSDELGELMHAVNRMATDLDEREQRIALDNQQRSQHEKMLAVGALASGVAHEVNNPLAVIAGTAASLRAAALERGDEAAAAAARDIVAQAHRAAQVARHLAEAAAPPAAERDWVDLAALATRTVQWMRYDRRYRRVGFEVHAAPALPAVFSSAQAVQQALMQLLSLVCDSLASQGDLHVPVQLRLAQEADTVCLAIESGARLDPTRADVQRSIVLARASLAPLAIELAFGQEGSMRGTLKLAFPIESAQP